MAPSSSQKATGKKGGSSAMRQQHQRSRNTTPSAVPVAAGLPDTETVETETVELQFELFRNLTFEDMVDPVSSAALIPDSRSLDGILERLQKLSSIIDTRGSTCDRGMRLLAQTRKQRLDELTVDMGREDERRHNDEGGQKKPNKKKRKAAENLASGAGNIERSSPLRDVSGAKARKLSRDDSASSSLSPVAPRTPSNMDLDDKNKVDGDEDDSDSSDDGRPPPPARPQANTFGEDPSTFPDPTVYEILPVTPGMSEEEKKEIYSVATYPPSDLADLIAGDPPDKDFSSAKPSNQINFSTFSTYIDPYFRPFTEEDLAFLRERGDRVTPFVMPRRGKKHYTEIWAEEDGAMSVDSSPSGRDRLPPNQPRGTIENMDDDVAETDKLSVGPLLSRLLQAMRPEHRAPAADSATNGVNGDGDTSMNGIASFDFSFDSGTTPAASGSQVNGTNGLANGANGVNGTSANGEHALPSATFMPESNSEAWKKATHPKLDYAQVDERIKQELRHIGFLPLPPHDPSNPGAAPQADPATAVDYDGHYDDEVAARLRLLQARLHEQVLVNGARKTRVMELTKERMAHQEYQTILEDLDSQVQAAYLKRTRTMGKKPKKSRPGASAAASLPGSTTAGGAAGMARPGIGDLTKTLMERRRRWIENIGPVFDDETVTRVPRAADEGSSIFKPAEMAELLKREKEAWDEEVEDD
ncbi:chromatin-remodeling complexes subunit NGG1 [Echria macrotheca]|uniref:Chromatin-remodeling complexes subunit NGG1 n=1 Tax=Echria macrotheca TaxID=438768 RepID=A0AAJ0F9C6_9PEZI|nr:chromatin-remodeling complexes subunit NGG1 [Echria macrotheca]